MSTPALIASAILLAGVAARPIDSRHNDDAAHDVARHSVNGDQRIFSGGRVVSGEKSMSSVDLADLPNASSEDLIQPANPEGSQSPKLTGSSRDPGLNSPYMGSQRPLIQLDGEAHELDSPSFSLLDPVTPAATQEVSDPFHVDPTAQPSPVVVVLAIASIAAIILFGLTAVVVYASILIRAALVKPDVWRSISENEKHKEGSLSSSEKPLIHPAHEDEKAMLVQTDDDDAEDPDVPTITPSTPTSESAPALRAPALRAPADNGQHVARAFAAWTYDNWVTHFMFALFGWLGVFFGGGEPVRR